MCRLWQGFEGVYGCTWEERQFHEKMQRRTLEINIILMENQMRQGSPKAIFSDWVSLEEVAVKQQKSKWQMNRNETKWFAFLYLERVRGQKQEISRSSCAFVKLISNFVETLVFMKTHWMDITCIAYKDQLMWHSRWIWEDKECSASRHEWET